PQTRIERHIRRHLRFSVLYFLATPQPPRSPLFPYTTLFRSRMALGARPSRIVKQLLSESLLIACSSGAVGLLLGHWMLNGLLALDRKSTRLNSSHLGISYAVFCLKKKKIKKAIT